MSLFNSVTVPCPVCGTAKIFNLAASVNGDRRPDLRESILAGDFQKQECPACGCQFRPPPMLTYFDVEHGQWILVAPAENSARWEAFETQAKSTFTKAYGRQAPLGAQSIGARMAPRVVFGWSALQEKLLCAKVGLDDREIELLKLALLTHAQNPPLDEGMELRLVDADSERLEFAWLNASDERYLQSFTVARSAYMAITEDLVHWQAIRDQLDGQIYMDMQRLIS